MDYERTCYGCIWEYTLWVGEDSPWPTICICPALDDDRYGAVHDTIGEFNPTLRHLAAIAVVCPHYARRPPGLRRSVLMPNDIDAERESIAAEIAGRDKQAT